MSPPNTGPGYWTLRTIPPTPRWSHTSTPARPASSQCRSVTQPARPAAVTARASPGVPAANCGSTRKIFRLAWPAAALLFSCNGRGSRLFPEPSHDTGQLARVLGDIPVAGFFCAGELGPVGGRNYLHAFTASIALFPGQP